MSTKNATRSRRALALLGAVLAGAALVGCAPDGGADGPATTADVTSVPDTPTPSPSTSEEPVDPNDPRDPATWVVDETGIGPVKLGASFRDALQTIRGSGIGEIGDGHCEGVAYGASEDNTYDVQIVEDRGSPADEIVEVSVQWNGDTMGVGPRTTEGLGLGSTKAEVLTAYESADEVESAIDGIAYLSVGDGERAIMFEYVEGNEGAVSVAVVSGAEPAYEPCA